MWEGGGSVEGQKLGVLGVLKKSARLWGASEGQNREPTGFTRVQQVRSRARQPWDLEGGSVVTLSTNQR